jgi:exosortase H (IPTLxxWG-CTERM-specific)
MPRRPVPDHHSAPPHAARSLRPQARFLAAFLLLLAGGFTLLSLNPVNDRAVEPFTAAIARVSGAALDLLGEEVSMEGTVVRGPRFAVNIRNGCNGLETLLIFGAAVLAFPASWRARLLGLAAGAVLIQLINLVRVVALYLTGAYLPRFFDASHTVVWQTLVVLFGVLLWVGWAHRFALRRPGVAKAA